ncbi:hypothetical protein NFI96_029644, partial [Prochilodus magdalenae]
VQLSSCCNASGSLFVTQKNYEVNQNVPYETSPNIKYKLIPDVYRKLPQDMPWRGRSLGRCAVVGSGGILLNTSCGREIDSADFIIRTSRCTSPCQYLEMEVGFFILSLSRFNLAPVNNTHVGVKCDLMNINPSQLRNVYSGFMRNTSRLRRKLDEYTDTSFMIAAFGYKLCTGVSINLLKVMWPERHLLFYSPDYLRTLHQFWRGRGLIERRLSTGFMLISAALELCEDVHVYGFWPFSTDLNHQPTAVVSYQTVME